VEDLEVPQIRDAWLANQRLVGWIGLAMPIILILGEAVIFPQDVIELPRHSLSAYFYSGMSGVFVGSLCIMGTFLICYRVRDWSWENLISGISGILAWVVALFPTGREHGEKITAVQLRFGEGLVASLHVTAAVGFIGSLVAISFFFSVEEHLRAGKGSWLVHAVSALVMMVGSSAGIGLGLSGVKMLGGFSMLLIVEITCCTAFGVSWLWKGKKISERGSVGVHVPTQSRRRERPSPATRLRRSA
jgi:hypothetical protein